MMNISLLNRFSRDDRGVMSIDFVIAVPVVMMWLIASVTVFDGFIKYNKTVKAAATIASMFSRLENTDHPEMDNVFALFQELAQTNASSSGMRLTSVKFTSGGREKAWSYGVGNFTDMSDGDPLLDSLPAGADGEYIMFLEITRDFEPMLSWDAIPATTFTVSQPFITRFTGKLTNEDQPEEVEPSDGTTDLGDPDQDDSEA